MAGEAGTIIDAETAGRLLMVTPTYVRQLQREGWFAKKGRDQFDLIEVVQGYIRFLKNEERRSSKSAAATRISDARAREIELRTAQREKRVIDYAEHIQIVDEMAGVLRTELSGLPARSTRDLQLRRTIETAVNGTLQRIADIAGQKARKLGPAAPADATADTATAGSMGGSEPNAPDD